MEKILQWSTAQQSDDPEVRAKVPAPDPKILAQVLGADTGRDDATLMNEDISVVLCDDPKITIDDKLTALEDFEMLIQNLDNANNMSPMGIWPEISKLYTYTGEEQDEFRGLAALITGSAVQNNIKCQNDFLNIVGKTGFENLLNLVTKSNHFNVKARSLYALTGLVSHNGAAYELFSASNGWETLKTVLAEDFQNDKKDNKVLLRSLNLLKGLLYDEIIQEGGKINTSKQKRFEAIKENNIIGLLINKLSTESHVDVNERIINILFYASQNGYPFSETDLKSLKLALANISTIRGELNVNEITKLEKL